MLILAFPSPGETELSIHVGHSNAIEGIEDPPYGPGTPEVDDHMAAARLARGGETDVLALHFVLARRLLGPTVAGTVRRVGVRVGGFHPPEPGPHLALHMDGFRRRLAAGPAAGEDPAAFAWRMHHEFESVHPFPDGNGRTGRLLLNALRLRAGLAWLVVGSDRATRYAYYDLIVAWRAAAWDCPGPGGDPARCGRV